MRRLSKVLWLTGAFACVEFLGAYFSNSLSLAADGFHMLGDVGGVGLAWVFAAFAQHGAISERRRAEALGGYTNGILLIVLSLILIAFSYLRFFSLHEVEPSLMLGIGGAGLGVNILGMALLHKEQKGNLTIRGAYLHIRSDALSSVGVVVGALVIGLTGQTIVDPIIGILIALLILWSAKGLLKESWFVITRESRSLNGVVSEEVLLTLVKGMRISGVQSVHAVTIKRDGHFAQASLHVVVAKSQGSRKVLGRVRTHLRSLDIRPRIIVCGGEGHKKCKASVS